MCIRFDTHSELIHELSPQPPSHPNENQSPELERESDLVQPKKRAIHAHSNRTPEQPENDDISNRMHRTHALRARPFRNRSPIDEAKDRSEEAHRDPHRQIPK